MADTRSFWLGQARFVALRHNIARWLDLFLPTIVGLSGLAAAVLLLVRQAHLPLRGVWWAIAVISAVGGVASYLSVKKKFLTATQAMVRLEDEGRLHNRLTSAEQGVGSWPAPVHIRDASQWNWRRILGLTALAAFLIVAGAATPLPSARAREIPNEQPIGWNQMDSWLQTLQDSKLVQPPALEKLQSQMDELHSQPPEKWYDQSSLEAGDSLRQQTEAALRAMQQDLQKAQSVVNSASGGATSEELKQMDASMQQAVEGLENGTLPLNKDMLNQLKDFKPGSASLANMSPEDLQKLEQRLKDGAAICKQCLGPSMEENNTERKSGRGGPGGGGETEPLWTKDEPTNLDTKKNESVSNPDPTRALPAELLDVTATAPKVRPKASDGMIDGGATRANGEGGEAVWRDSVTPQERQLLQRFFK